MPTLRLTFLMLFFLIHSLAIQAQESNSKWTYNFELRGGINLVIYDFFYFSNDKKPTKGPGTKGFFSFLLTGGSENSWAHTNYGMTVVYYQKSLGNNFNPIYADYQIDIIHSFGFGFNSKTHSPNLKYLNTMSSNPSYNYRHDYDFAGLIATNWILNNHGRNQWVGSINLTMGQASVNYYNDGGPPINQIGTGDRFDRWWTGGGGIIVHNKNYQDMDQWEWFSSENIAELTYNQFTGYSPMAYEISNVLGIDIPSYKDESELDVKTTSAEYNASGYDLRINFLRDFNLNTGIIGSLRSNNGTYWGVQDIIHLKQSSAFHPNNSSNRHYIGIITNHSLYENSFK